MESEWVQEGRGMSRRACGVGGGEHTLARSGLGGGRWQGRYTMHYQTDEGFNQTDGPEFNTFKVKCIIYMLNNTQ